ncbi:MAG: hypothetical protein KDD70_10710 [Bdellovibrionales bacterium]|nr:hypothetical protein [Bdellovibrionales bacterium]
MHVSDEPDAQNKETLELNSRFGLEGVQFSVGADGLTKANLRLQGGTLLELYLKGAHITSWIPSGKTEVFYLSACSEFKNDSIRGGIPIIFPQFGGLEVDKGRYPQMKSHGFARHLIWKVCRTHAERGLVEIDLHLAQNDYALAEWPGNLFEAVLSVRLAEQLELELKVSNVGDSSLRFGAGFHPYFQVENVPNAKVRGFQGLRYEDALDAFTEKVQGEDFPDFSDAVNRVYHEVPSSFALLDSASGRTISIQQEGFPDVVLWRAAAEYAREKSDMGDGDHLAFVCVEPAAASTHIELPVNGTWIGKMIIGVS